jgi:hypothetical protein
MRVGEMDRLQAARIRGADSDLSTGNPVDENAISIVAQRLMREGMDRPSAYRQAHEYVLLEKQNVRDYVDSFRTTSPSDLSDGLAGAPQTPVGNDATLAGRDGSGRDWSNWSPGMPLPAMGPDGSVLADNARRAREAERVATNSRARNEAIGEKYSPKAQEIAEAGDARGVTDYNATRTPEEQARVDYRKQLEKDARHQGPDGASRQKLREQDTNEGLARKAFRDKLAATPEAQAAKADRASRQAAWRAQSMLAGGQPTGGPRGTKAAANAWTMMGDQGLTDDQRSSLRYMLPGGQFAAEVDARANQQAFELAKQMALGAGFQDTNSPAAQAALTAKAAQAQEALPPEAAAEAERASNGGVLPANSSAGQRMLKKIEQETIGPVALQSEVDTAVEAAVAAGVPRSEAEKFFAPRRKNWNEWWGFGQQPGQPPAGVTPGSVPPV